MVLRKNGCVQLVSIACLGIMSTASSASAVGHNAVLAGSTYGFVTPCGLLQQQQQPRRQRSGLISSRTSSSAAPAARMTASEEQAEATVTPYSDLPADWRAPLPPREFKPKGGAATGAEDEDGGEGVDEKGMSSDGQQDMFAGAGGPGEDGLRTAAEALQEATRVTPSSVGMKRQQRMAEAPPGVESLQTENQRRRTLPLSKLKRAKPKKRVVKEEEQGEIRPLLLKTDRESVLRGEDYWIDYSEVDKKKAIKDAKAKAPKADQFAQSKMKAEIINPYKQNWILVISIAIVAIAGFVRINPGILDDPSIITFPNEL